MITEFGNKEILSASEFAGGKAFLAAVRRIDDRVFDVKVGDVIALDPGAEIAVGNVVFKGAGTHAASATDAFGDVKKHAPPVFRKVVGGSGLRSSGKDIFPGGGRGGKQDEELAAREAHLRTP